MHPVIRFTFLAVKQKSAEQECLFLLNAAMTSLISTTW